MILPKLLTFNYLRLFKWLHEVTGVAFLTVFVVACLSSQSKSVVDHAAATAVFAQGLTWIAIAWLVSGGLTQLLTPKD